MGEVKGFPYFEVEFDKQGRVHDEEQVAALRSQAPRELAVNRAQYLQRVDGLMFGDNPREGVIRGNAFLHPALQFQVTLPSGWQAQNLPQAPWSKAVLTFEPRFVNNPAICPPLAESRAVSHITPWSGTGTVDRPNPIVFIDPETGEPCGEPVPNEPPVVTINPPAGGA